MRRIDIHQPHDLTMTWLCDIAESISLVVLEIGGHKSAKDIFGNLNSASHSPLLQSDSHGSTIEIPGEIQNTYIQQSSYWLTVFPCVS